MTASSTGEKGAHLGSDELEAGELPVGLIVDDLLNLGIDLAEVLVETGVVVLGSGRGHVSKREMCRGEVDGDLGCTKRRPC